MDSTIEEIAKLQEKKEKAQTLLTRYKVNLETLMTNRDELVKTLFEKYNTSVDDAPQRLEELKGQLDTLLDEAKKSLDQINL